MKKLRGIVARFHNDERGSNSLEQIVIFALGVMVLAGVWYVWKEAPVGGTAGTGGGVSGWIDKSLGKLAGFVFGGSSTTGGGTTPST